jgi:ATP/maltotriose-dependent transcriptional regulator MalT
MTAAARAAAAAGDLATATERLAAAEALVGGRSPGYVTARMPLARAAVALASGDPATAAAEAEAARSAFVAMGAADAAEASVDLGRALRAMGDRDGARRRFEEAAAAFERHGWHHWLAVTRAERGATG